MTFGDVLYFVGFHVEYTAVRVGRGTAFWLRELARALVRLLLCKKIEKTLILK